MLLIGPRSGADVHRSRSCLDSEAAIRQRLTVALQDPASAQALRRFWADWRGEAGRISGIKDHSLVEIIARMSVRGPLIVLVLSDGSLHRGNLSAARLRQGKKALLARAGARPWTAMAQPPAAATVSMARPAAPTLPAVVAPAVIAAPTRPIGDWSIAEKLAAIVLRTADSKKLSADTKRQLKGMLSDPTFVTWLVGSLLVWFVSQFFVVGEIFDMLLAGAALALSGAGFLLALKSLGEAAHLIGRFVKATRAARDEKGLDAAADILADIIVMIGITVLIAALTHAAARATTAALEGKGPAAKPPPEPAPKAEQLRRRSTQSGAGSDAGTGAGKSSPEPNASSSTSSSASTPAKSPILLERKLNTKEPGAVPSTDVLKREIRQGSVVEEFGEPPQKEGWPKLTPQDYASFKGEPEPIQIQGPRKLYRVVGSESNPNGAYWSLDPPPATEAEWRSSNAVTNNMNGDGGYVVHELGQGESINAWSGPIRAQQSADGASALPGGSQQLFLGKGNTNASAASPTPWNR